MRSIKSTENFFMIVATFTVLTIIFGDHLRAFLGIHIQEWYAIIATLMLALFIDITILLHDVLGQADRLIASYKVHRYLKKKLYQMENWKN